MLKMNLNKNHIKRQFDRSAFRYDAVAGMQQEIVDDLIGLVQAQPENAKPKRILDAGCGTGYGLRALSQRYSKALLYGLDLAPQMLKAAHQLRSVDAEYVQGDIESLPFDDGYFDVVWSSSAIQWCDLIVAVNELSRVTKPGGSVLISTFTAGTLKEWRAVWGVESGRFVDVEKISIACKHLAEVELHEKTYTQEFTSFDDAVTSIRELGAGNAEEQRSHGLLSRERFRSIKSTIESIIQKEGCIALPYNVVLVSAIKKAQVTN